MLLPDSEKSKIIKLIESDKTIPEAYKDFLFPTAHKEYQLSYSGKERKEDILADNEESKAVPFQVEKVFNGERKKISEDWQNLLIFGDNLQILKSFYRNEDDLIKDKVKGKVKLIYIDPPFATKKDFSGNNGAKAYTDKVAGSEFIEFLRKRLIVAREVLSEDGSIFVHLDSKKGHYIKVILDEIFNESSFRSEIIWLRSSSGKTTSKDLSKDTDCILWYSKSENYVFNKVYKPLSENTIKMYSNNDNDGRGKYRFYPLQKTSNPGPETTYEYVDNNDKKWACPKKGWRMKLEKLKALENDNRLYLDGNTLQEKAYWNERESEGRDANNLWDDIHNLQGSNSEIIDYPTQKPESLLERIIKLSTNREDIVLDFFAGSGTTPAVAEKLGRRWIACDIGKLSVYTMQKRLLEIENSKDLENPKKKYGKKCKSFSVVASGLYNLEKVFDLPKEKYIDFVKQLFEIEETRTKSVNGIVIDGQKRGFYVKIFPYWKLKDVSVDENYLKELHKNIGKKVDRRFYVISPAQNNGFIGDYHEIEGVRYYFLRVPYQVIKELHKVQFKKLRQPQKKESINDIDESIGFHFVRPPEVKAEIKKNGGDINLEISDFRIEGENSEVVGFEGLAMVLLDFNSNGKEFVMDEYHFTSDLVKAGEEDDLQERIQRNKKLSIPLSQKKIGEKMIVIYVDIYGNEFRQPFNLH